MQAAAAFFTRISPPMAAPFTGGASFAALALNLSSYLTVFTTLGLTLTAKIVLGLLLALGPLFVAFLLFESTRGIFEGWLRAALGFAFMPLFATLALVVQLTLLAPYLLALAQMVASGRPDLPAATAVFILTLVAALVSMAGVIGLFIAALGFRLPGVARLAESTAAAPALVAAAAMPHAVPELQPRIASLSAATAAMDRRDVRLEAAEVSRRLSPSASGDTIRRTPIPPVYRRQSHRSASSARRDK
jgi:type IV secretion system protein VirB6